MANKKLKKVIEYINALHMDMKEGTLKRVAPTKHPVEKLRLDVISEDSDEAEDTFFNQKEEEFTSLNLTLNSTDLMVSGSEMIPFAKKKTVKSLNNYRY